MSRYSPLPITDRFPSAPIITESYPKNLTVVENSTAEFHCPILSDLGAHIEWAKFYSSNTTNKIPEDVSKLEVSTTPLHGDGKSSEIRFRSVGCRWFSLSLFSSLGVEFPTCSALIDLSFPFLSTFGDGSVCIVK